MGRLFTYTDNKKRGQVIEMSYLTITMWELEDWIANKIPMYLVDLRNPESYEQCHLMGAHNIPFQELEEHLEEFPKDFPIVFYCSRGSKSMLACNRLWEEGYQVINAGGGLAAYRGNFLVQGNVSAEQYGFAHELVDR